MKKKQEPLICGYCGCEGHYAAGGFAEKCGTALNRRIAELEAENKNLRADLMKASIAFEKQKRKTRR